MKKINFDTIYNRHIRQARKYAKNTHGMNRAYLIAEYFAIKTNHPHVRYTYEKLMMGSASDYWLPIELMQTMAALCAENEILCAENELNC